MILKFSCYEYELIQDDKGWYYIIYDPDYKPCEVSIIRQGEDWLESSGHANLAAIGHISLLENGEG